MPTQYTPQPTPQLALQQLNKTVKHRPIRDLAWALFNPALFSSFSDDNLSHITNTCLDPIWQEDGVLPWLYALDNEPAALLSHLQDQRATRLGIYFEQLLSFYFAEYPRFTLLAKNLQANDSQRTIGEYDFIVWDQQQQQHYHIEVAVKFYVGIQVLDIDIAKNIPIYNWHLWVGPNKKDSLGIKMKHLGHHQLRLAETEAGKNALQSIGLTPEQLEPKLLFTGRLYYPAYPLDTQVSADLPLDSYHSKNNCSPWLTREQLLNSSTFIDKKKQYIILPRQLWMSELSSADIDTYSLRIISAEELPAYLSHKMSNDDTPLHIVAIQRSNTEEPIEEQRFFLLP